MSSITSLTSSAAFRRKFKDQLPPPPKRGGASRSNLESKFLMIWETLGGPPPVEELKFCPTRRWRFDFAWPAVWVAVEIEGLCRGGQGRHQTPKGFHSDAEKYFAAAMAGWTVLRIPPKMISTTWAERILRLVRAREAKNENARTSG